MAIKQREQGAAAGSLTRDATGETAARAGAWMLDEASNAITLSWAAAILHGTTPEAFGGSLAEFGALFAPDDRERALQAFRRALETDEPIAVE
jgi:hypothetical protein